MQTLSQVYSFSQNYKELATAQRKKGKVFTGEKEEKTFVEVFEIVGATIIHHETF